MTVCTHHPKTALFVTLFVAAAFSLLAAAACSQAEEERGEMRTGQGVLVEEAWARPGTIGRMSAGYFRITNHDSTPRHLTGVSSEIARTTEIHESYEIEEGMMGMREVPELELPPGETIEFRPGGLHIMFIQLFNTLRDGDETNITLHFRNYEDVPVTMPVHN